PHRVEVADDVRASFVCVQIFEPGLGRLCIDVVKGRDFSLLNLAQASKVTATVFAAPDDSHSYHCRSRSFASLEMSPQSVLPFLEFPRACWTACFPVVRVNRVQ